MKPLAILGNQTAQYKLGEAYLLNKGVKHNLVTSLYWIELVARQGNIKAQLVLGHIGLLMPELMFYPYKFERYANGVYWLQKAADKGDPEALYGLGLCYAYGDGVTHNVHTAARLWEKAAKLGYDYAQVEMAFIFQDGRWVKRDLDASYYWFLKLAANKEHLWLLHRCTTELVWDFDKIPGSFGLYYKLLQTLAKKGEHQSQFDLAVLLYKSKQYRVANYWFKRANYRYDHSADYYLAQQYFYGYGVKQDKSLAYYLIIRLDSMDRGMKSNVYKEETMDSWMKSNVYKDKLVDLRNIIEKDVQPGVINIQRFRAHAWLLGYDIIDKLDDLFYNLVHMWEMPEERGRIEEITYWPSRQDVDIIVNCKYISW